MKDNCFTELCSCVFVALCRLSLTAVSGGYSLVMVCGLLIAVASLVENTGSRHTGSKVVVHGLSCSVICGFVPDQGLNTCRLNWQANSYPLCHQGSPLCSF